VAARSQRRSDHAGGDLEIGVGSQDFCYSLDGTARDATSLERVTTDQELLPTLLAQEERLVFPYFDYEAGWELGSAMRESALAQSYPIAILIRRSGQRIFHTALPGSSIDNDDWLERKSAVVDQFGHSSYYMGCQARADGEDFNERFRLDPYKFAAHGGAFPLTIATSGCIGSVAVSGLPQVEDHKFVVEQLTRFLSTFA
jgi:uncharacterized protein (UPF0303 family)